MKYLYRIFISLMLIVTIFPISANATYSVKNGAATFQQETLSSYSYLSSISAHDPYYQNHGCVKWSDGSLGGHTFRWDDDGGVDKNYTYYIGIFGRDITGRTVVSAGRKTVTYKYITNRTSKVCGRSYSDTTRTCSVFGYNGQRSSDTKEYSDTVKTLSGTSLPFHLISCTTRNVTLTGNGKIDGGTYVGSPAVNSNRIIVNKGSLTDKENTYSAYAIGAESESSSTTSGTTTITTVKLSNPPVIIDWADFPR